ncbi:MAG TPA: hypothetical protein VJS90_08425 [Pseudomonas sp.]|uniref:hypothetical protein n=1 Tax=Pseudomonas sp. TaxID=306 RepID=UPI002B473E74|nr:hypothetical protein [Pseudomonas sp.]HKS13054.1 hypothetical protein [Pseudomonas sp.]
MTKSTMFIRRLIIAYRGGRVYDERFHEGINVIRGDHSVGKTTILELLFYALGGEIKENQWLHPADKCDIIFCELSINGNIFTLRRNILKGRVPPISIREGVYDDESKGSEAWKTYGSRRNESDGKMSFSQQMFELLGWDSHKTDDYANLTMHQILRFLYVDQETASTKIFRTEDNPRADSEGIRTAIAEFLLGLDNLDTHKLRQDLVLAEREFERIHADLIAMYRVLGDESNLTPELLNQIIGENIKEIIRLSNEPPITLSSDAALRENSERYKMLESVVANYDKQLQRFRQELFLLEGEIADCHMFEESLLFRKKALLESKAAYAAIGTVNYTRCPCCLETVAEPLDGYCHLCKVPSKDSSGSNNYMELLNQLDFQIENNKKVQDDYIEHRMGLLSSIEIAQISMQKSQVELTALAKQAGTVSAELVSNSRKIGYLESQNAVAERKISVINELNRNQNKKVQLSSVISDLRERLIAAHAGNKKRRENIYFGLCENIVSILGEERRVDGKSYEEDFEQANVEDIEIDFAKDRMLVNGRVKFSGSSNYVKKNALNVSALIESIENKDYRLPRFMMLDAIENGGMTEYRSRLFQKTLVDLFKGRTDFQLIYCTSMVLDELNNDEYGVGPFYSENVLNI